MKLKKKLLFSHKIKPTHETDVLTLTISQGHFQAFQISCYIDFLCILLYFLNMRMCVCKCLSLCVYMCVCMYDACVCVCACECNCIWAMCGGQNSVSGLGPCLLICVTEGLFVFSTANSTLAGWHRD